MPAHCPLAASCALASRADWETAATAYYCPCRVRALLAAYAEVDAARRGGERVVVRGNRPAWTVQEEGLVQRADVANALRALWEASPGMAALVAANHGLAQVGDHLEASRGERGRVVRASAAQLARARGWPTREERVIRGGKVVPVHNGVREAEQQIADGVAWMADHLGWRPVEAKEE